jgi:hypothetical protein
VCAAGRSLAEALAAPESAPDPAGSPPRAAPFDAMRDLPGGIGKRLGRQPALAVAAILDALGGRRLPADTPLVLGTAHGAMSETIQYIEGAVRHGPKTASPLHFAASLHNAMAGAAGRTLDVRGPAIVVSQGDVSFEAALLVAWAMLVNGRAERCVVGASDAYHPTFGRGLRRVGLIAAEDAAADPRTGLSRLGWPAGEGGAALVLEAGAPGGTGVVVEDVRLGSVAQLVGGPIGGVAFLTSGERRSDARHAELWDRIRPADANPAVSRPASRYGVFGSLSGVAAAVEAGRRRASASAAGSTALVQAPYRSPDAVVVLGGHGPA